MLLSSHRASTFPGRRNAIVVLIFYTTTRSNKQSSIKLQTQIARRSLNAHPSITVRSHFRHEGHAVRIINAAQAGGEFYNHNDIIFALNKRVNGAFTTVDSLNPFKEKL